MKELIMSIVKGLVDNSNGVTVNVHESERVRVVEIEVPEGERGKIIGKHGTIINSIRVIANSASMKDGRRAQVEIIE